MNKKQLVIRGVVAGSIVIVIIITGVLIALGSLGDATRGLLLGDNKQGDPVETPIILQTLDRSELVIVLEGRVLRQPNALPLKLGE